jgi:hypothetical protein
MQIDGWMDGWMDGHDLIMLSVYIPNAKVSEICRSI